MKALPKVLALLFVILALMGCVIMYPDRTPEPIPPAELTTTPANSETEIEDAKQAAGRLIETCLEIDFGTAKDLYTPERIKRMENQVLGWNPWCPREENAENITLSDQYPYGQAIYFLYTYTFLDADKSTSEKRAFCLEMMKSEDGTWLANRNLDYHVNSDNDGYIEDCIADMPQEIGSAHD